MKRLTTTNSNILKRLSNILLLLSASWSIISCSRTPSHVIDTDDMAEVMADMYIAESVVDMNRHQYVSDSSRRLLRQSVLARHGYDAEEFDTSLIWYGHNYSQYVEVHDRTIRILEEKSQQAGSALLEANASFYGDSVDIWNGSTYLKINKRLPSKFVKFGINSDENTQRGDIYTWRVKLVDDRAGSVRWTMLANYSDSTSEYLSSSTQSTGWNEMTFVTDSTKTLTDISGMFEITADRYISGQVNKDLWLDSISLVRKRVNPDIYDANRYKLRRNRRIE